MSVRTTAPDVEAVLDRHYNGKTSLTPFIASASALVDKVYAADSDSELSVTDLELIERWLAAHLYFHADQILQSKGTDGASGSFQGQTGMVFMSTIYGQTACALDVTNYLAKRSQEVQSGMRRKVSLEWLGKPPSEQIDYEDRD